MDRLGTWFKHRCAWTCFQVSKSSVEKASALNCNPDVIDNIYKYYQEYIIVEIEAPLLLLYTLLILSIL